MPKHARSEKLNWESVFFVLDVPLRPSSDFRLVVLRRSNKYAECAFAIICKFKMEQFATLTRITV